MTARPPTAVVDVGGSTLKAVVLDADGQPLCEPRLQPTPYPCPPQRLLEQVAALVAELPPAGRVSVGFPGLMRSGRVVQVNSLMRRTYGGPQDPQLVDQWRGYALQGRLGARLGLPTLVASDADVAALASVSGQGLECMLTLGTGLGSSLVQDGVLAPHLELGGAPFGDGRDFEAALGTAGLASSGTTAWVADVLRGVEALQRVLYADRFYLGGGNARLLVDVPLPADVRLVDNVNGLLGGHLLWAHRPGLDR